MSQGNSTTEDINFLNGLDLMKEGSYNKAISEFDIAIKNEEQRNKAKTNKGICLYELQRHFEANRVFKEVIEQKESYLESGIAHFYLGDYLEAVHAFCLVDESNISKSIRVGQAFLALSTFLDNLNEKNKSMGKESSDTLYSDLRQYIELQIELNEQKFREQGAEEYFNDLKILRDYFTKQSSEPCDELICCATNLGVTYLERGIEKINKEIEERLKESEELKSLLAILFVNLCMTERQMKELSWGLEDSEKSIYGFMNEVPKWRVNFQGVNEIVKYFEGVNKNNKNNKNNGNKVNSVYDENEANAGDNKEMILRNSGGNLEKIQEILKEVDIIRKKHDEENFSYCNYTCWERGKGYYIFEKIKETFSEKGELLKRINDLKGALKETGKIDETIEAEVLSSNFQDLKIKDLKVKGFQEKHEKNIEMLSNLFYLQGVSLFNLKKYREAIRAFDCTTCLEPSYARAFNNKGNAFIRMNNCLEEAAEAYSRAAEKNKKYSIAYNNLGQVEFNSGNPERAYEYFEKAIACNPINYRAWTNKSTTFFEQGKYVEAKEALEKAIELKPDYALANTQLSKLLFYLGDFNGAAERIEKALSRNVKDTLAWRLKGQILVEKGNYQEAIRAFERAIRYSAGDATLILWKAYANYLYAFHLESKTSQKSAQTKEAAAGKNKGKISKPSEQNCGLNTNELYSSIIRELEMYLCVSEQQDENLRKGLGNLLPPESEGGIERKMYINYFLGCLYYKVGEYHKAINALKECKSLKSKVFLEKSASQAREKTDEIVKSAEKLLGHISDNCIESKWWTWWWSSPVSTWKRKSVFSTIAAFVFILIFIYPIAYPVILNRQISPDILQVSSTKSIKELSDQFNFDYLAPGSSLYYVFIFLSVIIFLSPYITSFTLKYSKFEAEVDCPKGFEFGLLPSLADDLAGLLDDIPD